MAFTPTTPQATPAPAAAEAILSRPEDEEDAEKLRKINEGNQQLVLPPASPEEHAAKKAMTPEQRKWKLEHPEWFDDIEPASNPREQGPALGD